MNEDATSMIPGEVRFVRDHLRHTFATFIDTNDVSPHNNDHVRQMAFFSRALAAQAVVILTGCGPEEAAAAVTDGPGDYGIDAIAFSPSGSDIWFIQAKWSESGRAVLTESNALHLVSALRSLAEHRLDGANDQIRRRRNRIDEALSSPFCTVHLVAALAGDGRLAHQAEQRLARVGEEFGFRDRTPVRVHTLGLADFHTAARLRARPVPVNLTATLTHGWFSTDTPYQSYVANVAVDELAAWYASHGDRLFAKRQRRSHADHMDRTDSAAVEGLIAEPENFWYFNSGVTVLCDSVGTEFFARRAQGQPVRLTLANAHVVNGGQTLASIAHAMERDPATARDALVTLRVICVGGAPTDFAARLAHTTADEHQTDPLDAVSDDPRQQTIREDFARSLNKQYVYRKGGTPPAPEVGCTVQEAALALACAHPDSSLAARVAAHPEYLFHPAPYGAYTRLFDRARAWEIWEAVLIHRRIRTALAEQAHTASRPEDEVIEHGELLLSHLVFRALGPDTNEEWALPRAVERRAQARELAVTCVGVLASAVARLYGPSVFLASVFTDERKCRELVKTALPALELAAARRTASRRGPSATRRPGSVALLVDHNRIPTGTRLLYRASTPAEERAIGEWLSEDPRRYLATWTNDRRKPLLWEADQQTYSPTALVFEIWRQAQWEDAPSATRGPASWSVPGEGTLAEIADRLIDPEAGTAPDDGRPSA
ncbi:AIPR family protein [Streptomyces amritsarensis]|uniref:AIPR family protein n=1 Tax=Streptomyces amritsarensis TaxID=681158 RepID=UPI0036A2F117